ncbi:MAG: four helix bundle protein [Candidatus Sulfotelmatobacter sp.]
MAALYGHGRENLRRHSELSQTRSVRTDKPNAKGGSVNSEQHPEGKGKSTDRDRNLFFCHARGSLLELETQILIAKRLKFLEASQIKELTTLSADLGRMLNALIQSKRSREKTAA